MVAIVPVALKFAGDTPAATEQDRSNSNRVSWLVITDHFAGNKGPGPRGVGRGGGVGRPLGVGMVLGVGVGRTVAVAVAVGVALGVAVEVGVGVGVWEGVGVGVGTPDGDTRT